MSDERAGRQCLDRDSADHGPVPAGSFSTTRWEGTFTLGQLRQTFTVYMVGAQEVRAEVDIFVGGTLSKKERFELMRGPVEVR